MKRKYEIKMKWDVRGVKVMGHDDNINDEV